jgi:hypothetical protein
MIVDISDLSILQGRSHVIGNSGDTRICNHVGEVNLERRGIELGGDGGDKRWFGWLGDGHGSFFGFGDGFED